MIIVEAKIRSLIIDRIKKSKDENIKGRSFQEESWLREIIFGDVADTVLYYISLQPDVKEVSKIDSREFYKIFKQEWGKWIKEKTSEPFLNLERAWLNGPGPVGGTAGSAEFYMFYCPGALGCKWMYDFYFSFDSWKFYQKRIEIMVFPKWKRENNFKNINQIFDLASKTYEGMKKIKAR